MESKILLLKYSMLVGIPRSSQRTGTISFPEMSCRTEFNSSQTASFPFKLFFMETAGIFQKKPICRQRRFNATLAYCHSRVTTAAWEPLIQFFSQIHKDICVAKFCGNQKKSSVVSSRYDMKHFKTPPPNRSSYRSLYAIAKPSQTAKPVISDHCSLFAKTRLVNAT